MSFGIPVRNGLGVGLLASTFLSSRRAAYPAMSLDFLQPFLDSRITFSRGSNATLVDATGKTTYAPANLLVRSQEFEAANWTKVQSGTGVAPTVTANSGDAPDGTTTADRVQFNLGGGTTVSDWSSIYQFLTYAIATNYVYSVWLRSNDSNSYTLLVRDDAGSGASSALWTVTPTWQRFSYVATSTSTNSSGLRLWLRGASGTSSTADVLAWGAQLEPVTYQTTPSTYIATTASAYYGPRFDYDPVTLAPKGLLIEEARTNLLTYSQDWTNAAWSKANATVTAAATTSPDGTVNAQRLQATTTAATLVSSAAITVTATSASYSVYVKQGSGATTANTFALRNNTTATNLVLGTLNYSTGVWAYSTGSTGVTVTNGGNGWWRLQISASAGITSGDTLIVYTGFIGNAQTAGDHLFAYGAQLEAGSFATSYIPTVASTVTRSADVATMTGTNFSSWFNPVEGTFVSAFDFISATGASKVVVTTNDGTSNNLTLLYVSSGAVPFGEIRSGGVVQALMSSAIIPATTVNAGALAYKVNDFASAVNGGAVATDTAGAVAVNQNALNIGYSSNFGGLYLNGHIRQIAYYNTRLPNAQLQTLTAPSLATTLSLSFTNQAYTVGV